MDVEKIKQILIKFREDRDWNQFHDPKNLSEALSIEAGELLELFLWKDKQGIADKIATDEKYKERIAEELADVLIYGIQIANQLDFDLEEIILDKLRKAEEKYPIDKAKGNARKYDEL